MLRRPGFAALSSCARKRFVPPWEVEGKTAEEFFGGILTSSNPLSRSRRERRRAEEQAEAAEVEAAMEEAEWASQRKAVEEQLANMAARDAASRDFLPYGAKPHKYFDKDQMAAWGYYQNQIRTSPSAAVAGNPADATYSEHAKQLLLHDADQKLPYRFESLPPRADGAPAQWPLHGTVGVVLDIDGVVYRSRQIIEGSDEAIRYMDKLKIPFLFMTNGGGHTEADRARDLSEILGVHIHEDQVIMSHTPMQLLAPQYATDLVLIVGHPKCAQVAKSYGFQGAMSMLEFQARYPELVPLKHWNREVMQPLTGAGSDAMSSAPYPSVAAIFQFSDMYDGFNDIQVILDVLTSPFGKIGSAVSGVQTVPFYFPADDLVYASRAPLPRLGGGAFREMLSAVFESVTGRNLHVTHYGKPRAIQYAFAEQRLRQVSTRLGWKPADMRTIAMVGDNIDTDIVGANARGDPWLSVHVMSGVGTAPAARRTVSEGDSEMEWLENTVSRVPHYVAPTLDHFVRELLAFPEQAVTQNRPASFGPPCPTDLAATYNFQMR